jgi:inosine-uridine nucleoside N-ribohydrolase
MPARLPVRPVPVVLDTDMGNDVDDALALAMLHAFESRGEARLLAVTVTKDNAWAAPYVDLVNTFYGRPHVPVGVVREGKAPHDTDMIRVPATRTRPDGALVYPHALTDGAQAPEATAVLRRALAGAEDGTVVVVQIGFSTNLARLLDTPADDASPLAGRDLAARKVRRLSVMAGNFAAGNGNFPDDTRPEYNVETDLPAAQKLFSEWPSPVVASGFEVGVSMRFPAHAVVNHMAYVEDHPVAEAYRLYRPMPYNRPTWDLTAVLYAVRPDEGYFGLSVPGTVRVRDDGTTWLDPHPDGRHRVLTVDDVQKARALEAMVALATQPPTR